MILPRGTSYYIDAVMIIVPLVFFQRCHSSAIMAGILLIHFYVMLLQPLFIRVNSSAHDDLILLYFNLSFRKLNSFMRYRLFRSYCTSFCDCELWSLDNCAIEKLCTAWRRGLRKVWNVPPQAHCYLLAMMSSFV